MSLTYRAKGVAPGPLWKALKLGKRQAVRSLQTCLGWAGLNVALRSDYYSPMPVREELAQSEAQWNKPSALAGLHYDLDEMQRRVETLAAAGFQELPSLPAHSEAREAGFGPGFPYVDAIVLYAFLRQFRPRRYLEVGSGLSTYYATLAAQRNRSESAPMEIECIEPFPYPRLKEVEGIKLRVQKVQEVPLAAFEALDPGDLLFIDSSHALKIGSDVSFLLLEVLPKLKPGVFVHIHDMPFPYNIPYPPEFWILERNWPIYWNEAMAVQAFLAFNTAYEIFLSLPLLRFYREEVLEKFVPKYPKGQMDDNTFSSLWLRRN